jgi:RNA-directed DNA polymerase
MTVVGLKEYLKQHWPAIRKELLNGTYEPKPVRRVEIPEPDGGVRKAWHPDGAGAVSSASGDAGSAEAMGLDVFRAQLRVPTGAVGPSGGGIGSITTNRVNHDKVMGQIAKRVEGKRLLNSSGLS